MYALRGDFGFDRFGDFVDRQTQAVRNHGDGFGQADVLDDAFLHLGAKFFHGHAGADFLLQRQAALCGINDAQRLGVLDALGNGRQRHDQLIHDEAGIHTGADQRHARILRRFVQFFGQVRMGAIGVGELFAGGNNAGAHIQTGEKLIHDLWQRRRSCVHDHIR